MKKCILSILFVILLTPVVTQAAWTDDFLEDYKQVGIVEAIENALEDDITPEEILAFIISDETINNKAALKAIYCAGVDRDAVAQAAAKLGVSEETLAIALEESIAECGSKMVLDDRENSGILASPSRPANLQKARHC